MFSSSDSVTSQYCSYNLSPTSHIAGRVIINTWGLLQGMVLHDLHACHILLRDIVGGYSILGAQQVAILYIEAVNRYSIVAYLTVFRCLYTGKPFQNISDSAVSLL